jgi:DNA-binding IclR family transcriptional regulator
MIQDNAVVLEKRKDFTPQTFKKAIKILSCFTMENLELSAKELAYMCQLSVPSLYRYLSVLEDEEFLVKDPETGRYAVGMRIVELSGIALSHMSFRRLSEPALDRMSSELKMNSNLGVLYKADLFHIAFAIWMEASPTHSIIGRRTPAVSAAMGKVLLSSYETKEVHELINKYGWRPKTPKTIKNFTDLDLELRKIRKQGYAVDFGENDVDVNCLAFPILDQKGHVVAAISISTTKKRFKEEFDHILSCVRKNAGDVSYRMGYYGPYPAINIWPRNQD